MGTRRKRRWKMKDSCGRRNQQEAPKREAKKVRYDSREDGRVSRRERNGGTEEKIDNKAGNNRKRGNAPDRRGKNRGLANFPSKTEKGRQKETKNIGWRYIVVISTPLKNGEKCTRTNN